MVSEFCLYLVIGGILALIINEFFLDSIDSFYKIMIAGAILGAAIGFHFFSYIGCFFGLIFGVVLSMAGLLVFGLLCVVILSYMGYMKYKDSKKEN
jgi:hypothetical protein